MTLKLYKGASVRTRNGDEFGPIDYYIGDRWTAARKTDGHLFTWFSGGNYAKSGEPHGLDIIEIIGEEIRLLPSDGSINRIERDDVDFFIETVEAQDNDDTLNMYQRIATKSAIYPGKGTPFGLMYAALGLAEAGEVQNKVKKAFRDDGVIRMDQQWVAKWYGSEPGKGCSIWSVNEHGLPSEMLFHVGPDEKDLETGRRICEAHNASNSVAYRNLTPERRAQIIKELGGALWYIAAVCDEINATMSEVALTNLEELCSRGERGTLRGDGDNR